MEYPKQCPECGHWKVYNDECEYCGYLWTAMDELDYLIAKTYKED